MNFAAKSLLVSALALTTLTGCVGSGRAPTKGSIKLSAVPADLRQCLAKEVPAPLPKSMSREEAAELVAAFRKSDHGKTLCGQRLVGWYDAQRKTFGK